MTELTGKVAVVTGGSRGIGAAVARRLSREGMRVAVVGRDEAALAAVAAEIGGEAIVADVTERGSAEHVLTQARQRLGEIDVVVPNAGIDAPHKLADTTDEIWERVMAVNTTAVFTLCRAALPAMVARGTGRVVVVASTAGLAGYAYSAAYCASKHAVIGLVRALAAEIARSRVTINAVCPGFVATSMAERSIANIAQKTRGDAVAARQALERMSPQNRLIEPDEVAHAVAALLPDHARGIHGQAITINGGSHG